MRVVPHLSAPEKIDPLANVKGGPRPPEQSHIPKSASFSAPDRSPFRKIKHGGGNLNDTLKGVEIEVTRARKGLNLSFDGAAAIKTGHSVNQEKMIEVAALAEWAFDKAAEIRPFHRKLQSTEAKALADRFLNPLEAVYLKAFAFMAMFGSVGQREDGMTGFVRDFKAQGSDTPDGIPTKGLSATILNYHAAFISRQVGALTPRGYEALTGVVERLAQYIETQPNTELPRSVGNYLQTSQIFTTANGQLCAERKALVAMVTAAGQRLASLERPTA